MTSGVNVSSVKENILEAALNLFSEKGYKGTTTRAVAREAGVNELTVFRKFNTKRELFLKAVERVADVTSEDYVPEIRPSGDMKKDLTDIGMVITERMLPCSSIMKMVMSETDRFPDIWSHVSSAPASFIGALEDLLSHYSERGVIGNVDIEVAAVAYFSFFLRSAMMSAFLGEDKLFDMNRENVRKFVGIFANGVMRRS